ARMGSALNAAVTGKRMVTEAESSSLLRIAVAILLLTIVSFVFPRIIAYAVGGLLGWTGLFILVKAIRIRFQGEGGTPGAQDSTEPRGKVPGVEG
ncbi:MAG TPA: hypothetical protein VLS90_21785, partial [Thermodesulfobacteriota bacterium]|nr:hypothetical protein [Thermodesulfobacteriota bacterium]